MRSPPVVTLALVALLVTAFLGGVVIAGSGDSPSEVSTASSASSTLEPAGGSSTSETIAITLDVDDPLPPPGDPKQVMRIDLAADGNATWTVESRFLLQSESDIDDFNAYADAIAAGERNLAYDKETLDSFVALARESTDREMELVDEMNESRLESPESTSDGEDTDVQIGVISMTVTWTNFAVVDGNRIYVDDVFRTADGGTWFESVDDGQQLVINSPPNYAYEDVPRALQDGALVWTGPYEFEPGELEVTYLEGRDAGTIDGPPDNTSTGGDELDEGTIQWLLAIGLGAILIVIVGASGYYLAQIRNGDPEADRSTRAAEAPRSTTEESDAVEEDASGDTSIVSTYDEDVVTDPADSEGDETGTEDEPAEHEDVEVVDRDDGDEGTNETDTEAGDDDIDVELLSDEERVLRLLRKNNGRMKQASIVTETDWSNAKVSQLLSKMDENGDIDKLRIGRENLITLPEVDPTKVE